MDTKSAQDLLDGGVPLRAIQEAKGEQRLAAFIEALPLAVFVADATGKPFYANSLAQRLLGKDAVPDATIETLAQTYNAYVASTDTPYPSEQMPLVRALKGTISWVDDMEIETANGRIALRVDGAPLLEADGSVAFAIAAFRDITEERNLRERVLISDRMASLGTLAAGVAHEINNPLAYVTANLTFANTELKKLPSFNDSEVLGALVEASEGAERVRAIVKDLKTFSRHEDESTGEVDVKKVIEACINMSWNEIRHRAKLVKLFGDVPNVVGSEARLGQVILNLLVNAAQSIPEGRAERNQIRVSVFTSGAHVMVEIADTGAGIRPEVLPRIFDPFFTTKKIASGTGLGLAICHSIVKSIGGQLQVETEVGKGSVFRLALKVATSTPTPTPRPSVAEPSSVSTHRQRVLVVDDEPQIGRAVERMLRDHYDVVVVSSAKEALRRVRSGESFALVLSDLMMAEMTGMELYAALKEHSPAHARKMVFLTGGAFTEASRLFLKSVDNLQLEKPVDAHALRAAIFRSIGSGSEP